MIGQKLLPYKGIQLNKNPLYLTEEETPFIKNVIYDESVGMFTPMLGNQIYGDITLPTGINKVIGIGVVPQLGHTYVFGHNSNNNHFIYRINGNANTIEMISVSPLWNFQNKPEHYINKLRFAAHVFTRYNRLLQKEETVTYIFFCDDYNYNRFLCAEDCLATSTFTTPAPFFTIPGETFNREDFISLGVPTPLGQIAIAEMPRDVNDPDDITKQNRLSFKGWQFRIRHYNIWDQDSEHGLISEQYINVSGNSCISNSRALARTLKLTFSAGSPVINKIQIEFRNISGKDRGVSVNTDWFIYDTIDCYKDDDTKNWYERERNNPWQEYYDSRILAGDSPSVATNKANKLELLKYNSINNTFDYFFSADKQWTPISVEETSRVENFLPLSSNGVFSIYKNIGLVNNRRGFPQLPNDLLDKINFSITKPAADNITCKQVLRKITIWAVIYNPHDQVTVPIRKDGNSVVFGNANCSSNNPFSYNQVFPTDNTGKNQEGFIGCLRGTKYYCISKQYRRDVTGELTEVGTEYVGGTNIVAMQKFEFDVLPGTYVFQIASHLSSPSDDYQKTSTYTVGQTPLASIGVLLNRNKELVVNVTDNDFELKDQPFMIYDLTRIGKGCTFADATSVNAGYLYEDQLESRPISGANLVMNVGTKDLGSITTDHNGFYFSVARQGGLYTRLYGRKNGQLKLLAQSDTTRDAPFSNHYKFNKLYVYSNKDQYLELDRIKVSGKVVLCGNTSVGVSGVLVILSKGSFAITDSDGNFTIVTHDRMTDERSAIEANQSIIAGATENLIIGQSGTCAVTRCIPGTNCEYVFPLNTVTYPSFAGSPRTITIPNTTVALKGLNLRGPQMGGRYQLGIITHDTLGRTSFVQSKEKHIVNIPSLQETKAFNYSTINFNISSGTVFPQYVKKITFAITDNLAYEDSISWVAERIQYIDNSGKQNNQSPSFVRFYYESLSEYQKLNNFNTTVGWDFISKEQAVIAGDLIQVVANGDGTIYNSVINHLVSYDKDGKYVQVEYNEELKDLKDGCLIKLIRPIQSQEARFFYELPNVINVVNGVPQILSGPIKYVDSYLLTRQIPVPIEKAKGKDAYGLEITTDANINQLKNFPFMFEHNSPSDKWGYHAKSRGRVFVVNENENEYRYTSEISISKALLDNGVINGLHFFTERDTKRFDINEWGPFTGALAEIGVILVLCEADNFVVTFNDNTVRVNGNGQISAPSAENGFGRPERKIGNNYGCKNIDANTVAKKDGVVCFLDRTKSVLIFHNYSEARPVSDTFIKYWLQDRVNDAIVNNKYFHGNIDPRTSKYYLSSFDLKNEYQDADFINDLGTTSLSTNETIAINIFDLSAMFVSFVGEYYGLIQSENNAYNQFISFKRGLPYKHHETTVPYMNFFGVQCRPYVWSVANKENTKIKKFQSIETYVTGVQFFAYNVMTSANQFSRILKKNWSKRERFYAAAFLCDLNTKEDPNNLKATTVNKILDGDLLYGQYILVCLTTVDGDAGKYFEWTGNIIYMLPSEKSSV